MDTSISYGSPNLGTSARLLGLVIGITAGWIGLSTPAHAQSSEEAPYSPRVFEVSKLIDYGTYSSSPLEFPWTVQAIEEVPKYSRIDFKHKLDASYREVSDYFHKAYKEQTPAVTLKADASPTPSPLELKVYGRSKSDKGERFTLGHSRLNRTFYVDLRREEGNVYVIFQNASFTRIFGGMVPNRTPFKPVEAEDIPLR